MEPHDDCVISSATGSVRVKGQVGRACSSKVGRGFGRSGVVIWVPSDLHLGEAQRVLPPRPAGPLHAVCVGGVASSQVLSVQVGGVAVPVPPRPLVVGGAVVLRLVVVAVLGGELHPRVFEEGIT